MAPTFRTALSIVVLSSFGCVGDSDNGSSPGTLGGPCLSNGTCNDGLVCVIKGGAAKCDVADASVDAADASDASTNDAHADAFDAGPTFNDFSKSTAWSTFDTSTVNAQAKGFNGGSFDGRYIYLPPHDTGNGTVTRYDTQASFAATSAWSTFDTTSVTAGARGFGGSVFDGRYVYFVPCDSGTYDGIVARYDTQASFASSASWTTFDTTTVSAAAKGFLSGTFDGRYVYLVPAVPGSVATRYDTQASFTQSASWSTFDATTVNAKANAFAGAVYDGRYVYYFAPQGGSGIIARVDTQGSFTSSASWSTFDATTLNAGLTAFGAGAFDGRYVYAIPGTLAPSSVSVIARYDIQASFTATASWSTFDVSTVNANAKGFVSATFDGRFLYLSPFATSANYFNGTTVRYDTQSAFGTAASWSAFDLSTLSTHAKGYVGSIFDGRYVYFVPFSEAGGISSSVVARFDAKTPPSEPSLPSFSGSFY